MSRRARPTRTHREECSCVGVCVRQSCPSAAVVLAVWSRGVGKGALLASLSLLGVEATGSCGKCVHVCLCVCVSA